MKLFVNERYFNRQRKLKPGIEQVQVLAGILCSASALCSHSNETRALIANPLNSTQLGGTPYHFSGYTRVRA